MLLYIIRHGDPDYTTDTLTEKGKFQAERVGERLAAIGIDRVFSSPLGRARETAAPLCRRLGLECGIEEWARDTYCYPAVFGTKDGFLAAYYHSDGGTYTLAATKITKVYTEEIEG